MKNPTHPTESEWLTVNKNGHNLFQMEMPF